MNFQLMQSSFHLFVCLFFYQFAYKYAVHTVLCRSHVIFLFWMVLLLLLCFAGIVHVSLTAQTTNDAISDRFSRVLFT